MLVQKNSNKSRQQSVLEAQKPGNSASHPFLIAIRTILLIVSSAKTKSSGLVSLYLETIKTTPYLPIFDA
jgi:hypothetical protein